ncbi:MAG: InlB B-repeat-containing protein, partial [Bacteroidaceae bacterium]|nr:InlB B-repeat-containing protein [Bacteroidaceae bacterium]
LPSYVNKDGQDYYAVYWSGSLLNGKEYGNGMYYGAYGLQSVGLSLGGYIRYQGMNVRAVYSPKEDVPSITATIQFDANGGNGEMQPIRIWSDDVSDSIIIPSNIFTREGYKFTGWNTAADGSGTSYKEKEVVSMGQDMTLYAQWKEKIYLETLDGKIVKFTESVGSEYEASYGALVTLLPQRDIENAGLSADDYIGINLTYNWYGLGVKVINCIYINTKDYSLFSPTQYVAYTDESFEIGGTPYGATYGPGRIMFGNFEGEFDTQTNTLTFSHSAVWLVDVGSLQMGTDTYKVEFEEIME